MTHPASLRPGTWTVDPAHTIVSFRVRHLGISRIRGTFRTVTGSVKIANELGSALIDIKIDLTSVDTNNEKRDGHLQGPDFFDVENDSTMRFASTSIDVERGTITGDLTLRGTTRPIELRAEFHGVDTDHYGNTKAGFSATGALDRTDFGIDFQVALDSGGILLANEIKLEIDVQLLQPAD